LWLKGGPVYSIVWSAENDSILFSCGKSLTIKLISANAKANSVILLAILEKFFIFIEIFFKIKQKVEST
jgi:hypothetical protein